MSDFREGNRVEWVGPPRDGPGWPYPGERGWILSIDPPDEWVIDWDRAETAVYGETYLRKVEGQREQEAKRIPEDP